MEIWPEGDQELRHAKNADGETQPKTIRNRYYGSKSRPEANKVRVRYPKVLLLLIIGCILFFFITDFIYGATKKIKYGLVNSPKHIQRVNSLEKSYSIKVNPFFEKMKVSEAHDLFNNKLTDKGFIAQCQTSAENNDDLPESFNFYEEHRKCRANDIQRKCSSSYVESHISVYKAKLCAKGITADLSVDHILNCDRKYNEGCTGGYLLNSLAFVKKHGYIDNECFKRHIKDDTSCPEQFQLENCQNYHLDNYCVLKGKMAIQKEIMTNGPVIGMIDSYLDFLLYEEGIFDYSSKEKLKGSQFIKIVGWDVDGDIDYWVVESMWGKTWGEDGLSRVTIGGKKDKISTGVVVIYPSLVKVDG